MPSPEQQLRLLAAGQDGQFATAQALDCAVSRHTLARMRRAGATTKLAYGVSRFTSTPDAPDPAITAVLRCWPDGVISHASAAVRHGLRRVQQPAEPEVTVPHGLVHKLPGVSLHWSRQLPPSHIVKFGEIRYTALARTAVDLSDADKPWESLAILDDTIALGAKRTWIHHTAAQLVNGRGGIALLRDATAKDAAGEFRSWLERAAAHVYRMGHLPDPEWNARVYDGRRLIGIVDALWPEWRVISEKEGLRFHTTPSQRRKDAQRFNNLQDADFRPRRFTWEDVVHQPVTVVETLYRALRSAGADLDPVRIPRHIEVPQRPFM